MSKAKDYLNQIGLLNAKIENMLRARSDLMAMATRVTPQMQTVAVSSWGGIDKIGDAVAKIVDLDRRIDREIDALVALKGAAIARLNRLTSKNHYNILFKRYVLGLTFERIAEEMGYTYRGICYLHGRALLDFEKMMEENEK